MRANIYAALKDVICESTTGYRVTLKAEPIYTCINVTYSITQEKVTGNQTLEALSKRPYQTNFLS